MSESWPPALKDWVAKCLGQMTDATRTDAQAELRKVIQDAYQAKTLWTTDWAGIQLQSLAPKPSIFDQNPLKRKAEASPAAKKKKLTLLKQQQQAAFQAQQAAYVPPSISSDQQAKARRAQRFEREHELDRYRISGVETVADRSNDFITFPPASTSQRSAALFRHNGSAYNETLDVNPDPNVLDWDHHTIVGRSQEIFKEYLRLTEAPNPNTIRPLPVLQKTLEALKQKWKTEQNYNWICSQFKSLRQDLTVQRIKTPFTVIVYEIHGRMALEAGDLVEFNQCLSALKTLYTLKIEGRKDEFTAYRILYMLHARQKSELNRLIGELTQEQKAVNEIHHALNVSTAISTDNYHSLFQLHISAPNMGAYIMDFFVPRCRCQALRIMCKAYQKVPLKFIAEELVFENGVEDAHEYLVSHSASFYVNPNVSNAEKILDGKQAGIALATVYEEKYSRVAIKGSI